MKKFVLIFSVALAVCIFASCASITQGTGTNFYSTGTVTMAKVAEASNTVWLGVFGTLTYPLAEQIALDNGMTRIASVERHQRVGVFGLWTVYTTVVTGE